MNNTLVRYFGILWLGHSHTGFFFSRI
uniref:Uncharacterized protein n=1 Tax=Anguilla anguilla TaxID=7936 RepID=A0A0E9T959_ANGAN